MTALIVEGVRDTALSATDLLGILFPQSPAMAEEALACVSEGLSWKGVVEVPLRCCGHPTIIRCLKVNLVQVKNWGADLELPHFVPILLVNMITAW